MERKTSRRTIQIREHVVTVTKADLAEALQGELAGEGIAVKAEDLRVCVGLAENKIIGPDQLRTMLRGQVEGMPDGAEIVLAVRWREEVEAPVNPPAPAAPMGHPPPQYGYPQYAPPPPQYAPQQYAPPPPQPQYAQPQPQAGPTCPACGSQPSIQGPTPDCHDPMGCGPVRAQRGNLPVGRAVPPPNVGSVGAGILRGGEGGGGKLVNRETGETAFADLHGGPYGVGHDYDNR